MLKVQEGFEKANSGNLPELSIFAVCKFINNEININNVETRCVKVDRSSRKEYGDQSVGYVQVRRTDAKVKISGVITPEHKVHAAGYEVSAIIDESRDRVEVAQCFGCAASKGGCKHIVAFLFWINRRSEEPSPTEKVSYWKRSTLASLKGGKKYCSLQSYCGEKYKTFHASTVDFRESALKMSTSNMLTSMITANTVDRLSLHVLRVEFSLSDEDNTAENFVRYCRVNTSLDACKTVEKRTCDQSQNKLWYELRFGRITASNIYEAAHCNTQDGALVHKILGAKTFSSNAMKRGKDLEDEILKLISVEEKVAIKKCGLFLNNKDPIFGASPDGLGPDFVIEIKCPASENTIKNYISPKCEVKPKYLAQINLQMHFADLKKGLFVVADPEFERNKNMKKIWVFRDDTLIQDLLSKSLHFWRDFVYKFL